MPEEQKINKELLMPIEIRPATDQAEILSSPEQTPDITNQKFATPELLEPIPSAETSPQQITQITKTQTKKPPQARDELYVKIEKIMEEDLQDAFVELTPTQKQEFKIKGEETVIKIRALIQKTKVNIKKIVKLLLEWLKLLPGINKFFLEQEAKIKADKIIALKFLNNYQ